MNVSARSYVAVGVAALTAGVIALPTSVAPPAPPQAPVHQARVALTAATRPIPAPVGPPVAFLVVPRAQAVAASRAATKASPTAAVTAAAPQAALAGFPGIQDAIINGYNLVIPWVDYGVNLAQYAVGWIPVASFFAPQIGIFYYDLIRPIVTSAVYNFAYVIGGSIGLVQGVSNVINDSINAGIGFVNAEINWALSFLPPLPPFPLAAAQTATLKVTAEPTNEAADGAAVVEKHDSDVATSVEPVAKAPADSAKPAEPVSAENPEGETAEAAAEPVTPKPEAEPEKKPASATTSSSGGVAAQGEVRGGTESATDAKKPDEKKPEASKDEAKADEDAAPTTAKPAESSPGEGVKAGADTDTSKDAGTAKG